MRLKVLGSGSTGNCFLMENEKECLVLEAGIDFKEVLKALDFDLTKVVGCIITHEHKDHSKYIKKFIENGINVYMSKGTADILKLKSHYVHNVFAGDMFDIGEYKIIPFDVKHDAEEPLGYYINHSETGNVLFAADTYYIPNRFENMNNILVECNYSDKILEENIQKNILPESLCKRIIGSHMEFDTCKKFLMSNDLRNVCNVVLIHLSELNGNSSLFRKEIQKILPFSRVYAACRGLDIEFNKYLF